MELSKCVCRLPIGIEGIIVRTVAGDVAASLAMPGLPARGSRHRWQPAAGLAR